MLYMLATFNDQAISRNESDFFKRGAFIHFPVIVHFLIIITENSPILGFLK